MNRTSMKMIAAGVLLLLGAMIPTCVESQPAVLDLSGSWDLSTSALIPGEGEPCNFMGSAEVMQKGSNLYGRAYLALESGPAPCPAEMEAELTGVVEGFTVQMGMLLGQLGEAIFMGTVPGVGKGTQQLSFVGEFTVTVGPFADVSGGWGAVVSDLVFRDGFERLMVAAAGVPLLLLAAGLVMGRRRRFA